MPKNRNEKYTESLKQKKEIAVRKKGVPRPAASDAAQDAALKDIKRAAEKGITRSKTGSQYSAVMLDQIEKDLVGNIFDRWVDGYRHRNTKKEGGPGRQVRDKEENAKERTTDRGARRVGESAIERKRKNNKGEDGGNYTIQNVAESFSGRAAPAPGTELERQEFWEYFLAQLPNDTVRQVVRQLYVENKKIRDIRATLNLSEYGMNIARDIISDTCKRIHRELKK